MSAGLVASTIGKLTEMPERLRSQEASRAKLLKADGIPTSALECS